jgi:hypothetical protein
MTDITEVAKNCGAEEIMVSDGDWESGKFEYPVYSFIPHELQAFADHYRKEGAEGTNKHWLDENNMLLIRIAELETKNNEQFATMLDLANERDKVSRTVDSFKQQLAATELVVEQMREIVADACTEYRKLPHSLGYTITHVRRCEQALQLQPSLSALREHEAKVLEERAWLIEDKRPTSKQVQWLGLVKSYAGNTVFSWSSDSTKALRFARQEDAIHAGNLYVTLKGGRFTATEHVWMTAELRAKGE